MIASDNRWFRVAEALVVVVALAVRIGVLGGLPGALEEAPAGDRALARNLVEFGTLGSGDVPTAYRPPLYPLLLAPCVAVEEFARLATGALHVLLGVGTVWLVWRIGWTCGLGCWAAWAALLVACDPILLGQSAAVMSETPAAFLVALALLLLVKTVLAPTLLRAAALGAVMGLAGLCRPELLLWTAAVAPMVLLQVETWSARGKERGAAAGAALVVLVPWAARNQAHFGQPIVTTTHGGYTLLLANNPAFYEFLRSGEWGAVWDAAGLGPVWGGQARHAGPQDEWLADRRAYDLAWDSIRREPGMFAWACAVRAGRLWAVWPHQGTGGVRLAVAAWYVVEYLLAFWGIGVICRSRENAGGVWLWAVLLAVCLTGVHAVYWSDMRMRAALAPAIALVAAAGPALRRAGRGSRKASQKRDLDELVGL